ERAPTFRRFQPLARIACHDAVREQKLEVGANGGNSASNRGRGKADVLEVIDELAEHPARDVDRRGGALRRRVLDEAPDVAPICLERARRNALLERQEIAEPVDLEAELCAFVGHEAITARWTRRWQPRCTRCPRRVRSSP